MNRSAPAPVRFRVRLRAAAGCSLLAALACAPEPDNGTDSSAARPALRINDLQVVGSHNSYKLDLPAERMEALAAIDADAARALDYGHVSLEEQLDLGLRKLELDVFHDPVGDRYPLSDGSRPGPGFRVMHVQNLDDASHCSTLTACLQRLADWSDGHPGHLPVAVSVNAKDQVIERPGFTRPLPFDEAAWQALDATLRRSLGPRLLQPADVFATASEPLRWPVLEEARGRFLFVLDEGGKKRESYASRWHARAMFANLPADRPGAAFLIVNDPVDDFDRIRELVRAGFLVRTRADADTVEARTGDTTRRDRAFASGAHFVSTDYYLPARFGTGYVVSLPGGGVARCNPVRFEDRRPPPACGRLGTDPLPAVDDAGDGSGPP